MNGGRIAGKDGTLRDPEFALFVGLVYIAGILFVPAMLDSVGGVPRFPAAEYLATHANAHALSLVLPQLPATALLIVYLRPAGARYLKTVLGGESGRTLTATFVIGSTAFFFLDYIGVLPFTWRAVGIDSLAYTQILIRTRAWIGVAALGLSSIVLAPFLEEVIFRFGVLQWVLARTKKWFISIVVSAMAFALAHAGTASPNGRRLVVETFAFGLFTGGCVYMRNGKIGLVIVLHSAKNVAEFAGLIATASMVFSP